MKLLIGSDQRMKSSNYSQAVEPCVKLNRTVRGFFVSRMFQQVLSQNETRKSMYKSMDKLFYILLISKDFLATGLGSRDLVVYVRPTDKYESEGPHYLANFYRHDQQITNLAINRLGMDALLSIKKPIGIEVFGMPPMMLLIDSYNRSIDFDSAYIRFFHEIKKGLAPYQDRTQSVIPTPEIYAERAKGSPFFYHNIFAAFPIDDTFVFLPNLFLSDQWKECNDASFEIMMVDSDGKKREILAMKQNPNSENSIYDFCDGGRFDDIDKCEGLTFGPEPTFKDPKSNRTKQYAFKMNEEHIRLLIMVKCNGRGVGLVNRIIQTARIYFALLGEMPSIKLFDIAILVNMSRILLKDAQPFVFRDTIASKLVDNSRRKVDLVENLRVSRPDLRWFTDFCSPHASGRTYTIGFYPMTRNLRIVDLNPARYH